MPDQRDANPTKQDGSQPGRARAVAVKKEEDRGPLPRITARGEGKLAERILDIAFDTDVKVRRDADLTEILTKLDLETPIPIEALEAVSEILKYVYQMNLELQAEDEDSSDEAEKEVS